MEMGNFLYYSIFPGGVQLRIGKIRTVVKNAENTRK